MSGSTPQGRFSGAPISQPIPIFNFDIADGYVALHHGETLDMSITYLDQGADTWELEYPTTATLYQGAGLVQKTNTSTWKTVTFTSNRQARLNKPTAWRRRPPRQRFSPAQPRRWQ